MPSFTLVVELYTLFSLHFLDIMILITTRRVYHRWNRRCRKYVTTVEISGLYSDCDSCPFEAIMTLRMFALMRNDAFCKRIGLLVLVAVSRHDIFYYGYI